MPKYRIPEHHWRVYAPRLPAQPLVIAPFGTQAEASAYMEVKYGTAAETEGCTIIEVVHPVTTDDDATFDGERPVYAVECGAAVALGGGEIDSYGTRDLYTTVDDARAHAESFRSRRINSCNRARIIGSDGVSASCQ